jgi:hypothetical protein
LRLCFSPLSTPTITTIIYNKERTKK